MIGATISHFRILVKLGCEEMSAARTIVRAGEQKGPRAMSAGGRRFEDPAKAEVSP